MWEPPSTQFARSGPVHIAYQVLGDGPIDLIHIPGALGHLETYWEEPNCARFLRRLSSFARLALYDKRGTGMSDRSGGVQAFHIFTMWDDPAESERHIAWARAFHDELRPHMNGIYVNEMGPDERVHDAYSPATLSRLADVKATYDPANFFRMNQNIKPAG